MYRFQGHSSTSSTPDLRQSNQVGLLRCVRAHRRESENSAIAIGLRVRGPPCIRRIAAASRRRRRAPARSIHHRSVPRDASRPESLRLRKSGADPESRGTASAEATCSACPSNSTHSPGESIAAGSRSLRPRDLRGYRSRFRGRRTLRDSNRGRCRARDVPGARAQTDATALAVCTGERAGSL